MPRLPFRQSDSRWRDDVMWDRDVVIQVEQKFNGSSRSQAAEWLRAFPDGNTIGNEGCLLTSLAMVIRLLAPRCSVGDPRSLNRFAHEHRFYSKAGVSMTPLYADLVSDATRGNVQLLLKEDYLSGERGWPPTFASDCIPLKAYRAMPPSTRRDVVVMLKIGTYDDTVASHFLIVDPKAPGSADENDVQVLDPAQPVGARRRPWRLSDSSRHICTDIEIRAEWRKRKIKPLQLAGVWVFARWTSTTDVALGRSFLKQVARVMP